MRIIPIAAIAFLLTACSAAGPQPTTTGPRLEASLVATWPTAKAARQPVFRDDGALAALSDASGTITIRDTNRWRVITQLRHPGGATAVVFSEDGTRLFSAGYDGIVREWDVATGDQVRAFKVSGAPLWTLDISPDGKRLAAAGEDAIIHLWNLGSPTPPAELRGHTRNVWEVRFSPDGRRLASCSFDYSVRLWDAEAGRPLKALAGHRQACVGLDYSPDGNLLATGGDDAIVRYWRASDGAALRSVDNGRHVDKLMFSRDGKWLATGGHPHGLIGEFWHQLTGGGGEGDAVRLWRTRDGALVANLPHPDDAYYVAFSPDGRWLVTSGEDNRFRLWALRNAG
jgi:WD40 repeat protein